METLKRYRLWAIVVSCCMIVLGAAMILRPDISALAVCYLTGALCIAMGVCEIARYFSIGVIGILFRFDLIVGILSTLAGVLLLAHPTGALTVLPIILGFYIIIDSVFSIQAAVELRRFGLGSWGLNLLLGIVGAVLGVLMILDPFDGAAALMVLRTEANPASSCVPMSNAPDCRPPKPPPNDGSDDIPPPQCIGL